MKNKSIFKLVLLNFILLIAQDVYAKSNKMLIDKRDGKKYRIIEIDSQIWMAENLNFKVANSSCYMDIPENCRVYGRLYSWESSKRACPSGWHLPNKEEIEEMLSAVGGATTAGRKLRSKKGWGKGNSLYGSRGTDDYGFAALPGGRRNDGFYNYINDNAFFWISSEYDDETAYMLWLYQNNEYASIGLGKQDNRYSVRCIKDEE